MYRAGGLAGLAVAGPEGVFPGREQHPGLGRDDLDRRDRDQHGDLPERPGRGLQRRLHVPATGLRVSRRAVHRRHGPAAGLFPRPDLHRVSTAAGPVRRPDPDDRLAPVPGGALARRRPAAVPGRDDPQAPDRLVRRDGHRGRGDDHRRLHLPRRDEGGDLDRRHPVQRLYPRRPGGPDDPGRQAPRRLDRADRHGPRRRQAPGPGLHLRPDPALYLLGRPDRRDGAEHGDPRGRPDDGPALPLGAIAAAGGRGAGGQRLPHPGPVRPLPLHRRQPVGVLPAVPADDGRGIGRRRVRHGPTRPSATSSSTTCRPASSGW